MNAQGITKALGGRWHGSYGTAKGSTAKQITDVRDAARQHTLAAVETLVSVMQVPNGAPLRARGRSEPHPGSRLRQGGATY